MIILDGIDIRLINWMNLKQHFKLCCIDINIVNRYSEFNWITIPAEVSMTNTTEYMCIVLFKDLFKLRKYLNYEENLKLDHYIFTKI